MKKDPIISKGYPQAKTKEEKELLISIIENIQEYKMILGGYSEQEYLSLSQWNFDVFVIGITDEIKDFKFINYIPLKEDTSIKEVVFEHNIVGQSFCQILHWVNNHINDKLEQENIRGCIG